MLRTIAEHGLLARGDRVLVALSGGPDSTALLHGLLRVAKRLDLGIDAACIDHGLRAESAEEASTVAARAEAVGVRCTIRRVDVAACRGAHVSWQDAARRARLEALLQLAARGGHARIAFGHTADDQVETILQRIVRGTGLAGLCGIPYQRGRFVRPLLDVRRADVLAFLRRRGLPFIEDPSNADRRYSRARVRHEWLPLLRRENPRVDEAVLLLAEEVRARLADDAAPPAVPTVAAALASRGVSRRTAAVIRRLARQGEGTKRVAIPGAEVEVRYGEMLIREAQRGEGARAASPARCVTVAGPGTYALADGAAGAIEVREGDPPRIPVHFAAFDAQALPFPLGLRLPRPGDRMRPRGGRGSRKLQDLFVDARVPRTSRWHRPVLVASDGEILFVPGLRPASRGAPSGATRKLVLVRALPPASDGHEAMAAWGEIAGISRR
jgi:tRNA(Ile)-lysidine synthase